MIDVKQAIKTAFDHINDLYDEGELKDLALEEVGLSDNERYWFVTLGFTRELSVPLERTSTSVLEAFVARQRSMRVYKVFKIDALTGQLLSMKIREEALSYE